MTSSHDTPALVSVYLPTKNRHDQLAAAIDSVQAQTYPHWELLIVDDGSTDDTPALLQQRQAADPRVRFTRHDTSRGACAARNQAIQQAQGRFVTGLDDDDLFTPRHLEGLVGHWEHLASLGEHPSALYVQYRYRDGAREWTSAKIGHADAASLLEMNHVGNQLFAPRERFLGAGLFDEQMPAWQDLEFFYRLLLKYGPARLFDVPSYVFDVTPRPDRISSKAKDKILAACERMHAKHGRGDPRVLQRLLLQQVYSDYYGFAVGWRDVQRFMQLGFWPRGVVTLMRRLVKPQ